MINFIAGIVTGIVVSTIGFSGLANYLDKGVTATKSIIIENTN